MKRTPSDVQARVDQLREIAQFEGPMAGTSGRFGLPGSVKRLCGEAADEIEAFQEAHRLAVRDRERLHNCIVNILNAADDPEQRGGLSLNFICERLAGALNE